MRSPRRAAGRFAATVDLAPVPTAGAGSRLGWGDCALGHAEAWREALTHFRLVPIPTPAGASRAANPVAHGRDPRRRRRRAPAELDARGRRALCHPGGSLLAAPLLELRTRGSGPTGWR